MILSDYLRSEHDLSWDFAKQCGVESAVIRLPEHADFDITDMSEMKAVHDKYTAFGFKPVIVEPMPNCVHDHIKAGDELRDESIEKVIGMMKCLDRLDIRTICFNFMAHIGWMRTSSTVKERGDALVTEFKMKDFVPTDLKITKKELWDNYEYFIKAVIPYAEKYGIRLALHPDDPPRDLGGVERILTSYENIRHAVKDIVESDMLGITMCQATYHMMGENVYDVIEKLADKIFFVHFRNAKGNLDHFRETFHDNGELDMARLMAHYKKCGVNVPIRVDHVPTMAGEESKLAGYDNLGRLYAIGYLKGILEATELK